MFFELIHTENGSKARAGLLETDHGSVQTPVFMPVGTQGTVKAMSPRDLQEQKVQIILGNTYHLYLRPGLPVIRDLGGLHPFMQWSGPILTDSGGYQVFSLQDLRKLDDQGVSFQSHLDGSRHRFTPESVLHIQRILGSDIMMVLDECPPYPSERDYVIQSNRLTRQWAAEAKAIYDSTEPYYAHRQWLFAIVQGGVFSELRQQSARDLIDLDFPGYAIGGLSVGEPKSDMYAMTDLSTDILPPSKPRYLMGVGMPEDILEGIARGVDMFDCVIPTRNARNGTVFTANGKMVIKAGRFKQDEAAVDALCPCYTCRNFSRAYLRHLFNANEILGLHLATLHNIYFYQWLLREARQHILDDSFILWKADMMPRISQTIEEITTV
ncbi:MAG: tRNA guanosine(34) transglycosylase Tgt [Caldithrix sp.]|nr:tRNA guanosine(34) transglycosylase Tgt [Caldithrix sp.]